MLLVPLKVLLKQSADQYLFNAGPSQCPVPSDRSREAGANTLLLGLWLVNFAVGESSMVPRLDPRSSDQDGCHPACKLTCYLTPFISSCYLKNTIVECAVHKAINSPTKNHTKFCHSRCHAMVVAAPLATPGCTSTSTTANQRPASTVGSDINWTLRPLQLLTSPIPRKYLL